MHARMFTEPDANTKDYVLTRAAAGVYINFPK